MSLLKEATPPHTNARNCECATSRSALHNNAILGFSVEKDPGYTQQHTPSQLRAIEQLHASLQGLHDNDAHVTHSMETHFHPAIRSARHQNGFKALTPDALRSAGACLRVAHKLDYQHADCETQMAMLGPDDVARLRADNRFVTEPAPGHKGSFHFRLCDKTGGLAGVRFTPSIAPATL
mgnify:CR=1 FL=1